MKNNYKEIAKEISFNALKQGNNCVRMLGEAGDNGFDIESIEGTKIVTVGVKVTTDEDKFFISSRELLAMQTSNYMIHKYKFHKNKIKFNIYEYDKDNNRLVDITNPKNICTIESKMVNENGVFLIKHECTSKKLIKRNI